MFMASRKSCGVITIVGLNLRFRTETAISPACTVDSTKNTEAATGWRKRAVVTLPRRSMIQAENAASSYFWGRPVSSRVAKDSTSSQCSKRCQSEKRTNHAGRVASGGCSPVCARVILHASLSIAGQPPEVEDDVEREAEDHGGDEEPVVLPDEVNERRPVGGRHVVGEPGRREVGRGVLMAFLAGP